MITIQSPIFGRAGKMKKSLNSKVVFRAAGIIAIAALIGIALVSCASAKSTIVTQVTVRNTSPQSATVTLQGGSNASGVVQSGRSRTFQVPANVNITVRVSANGFNYSSSTFTVARGGTRTLTFNGTTVQ